MHAKDYVSANFTFDPSEVDVHMENTLARILRNNTCRANEVFLVPHDRVALQTAHDWLASRGWSVTLGNAFSGVRCVILRLSESLERHARRDREATAAPTFTLRPPPWERALPLPRNAPSSVVEARNRWFFDAGIYAPLDVLLRAYTDESPDTLRQWVSTLTEAEEHLADRFWESGDNLKGFLILRQPNSLQGLDALLFGILPGRVDEHNIAFDWGNDSSGLKALKPLFSALGSYIREVYPEVGDTQNAREDGLDYRVLASLAGHGIDPTDDNPKNPELATQWEECRKDPLVLGAFAALQRLGEMINDLFPEKPEEEGGAA
jgi:hypothetical protein